MYDLRNLREMLCKELDEISDKREMSAGDLDAIQKLTSSIKNTYKIEMAEDGGYSRDGECYHLLTENSIVRKSIGRCHFRISGQNGNKKAL